MKADYSRFRFNLNKGYTRVLLQQGRVTLDADWNEQVSIQADLDCKRSMDVIGQCGVPYGDAGFLVGIDGSGPSHDLTFGAGTIYVAGRRINLEAPEKYGTQPFLPDPPAISDPGENSRVDLVYLCVRERHITYLEDDTIREIALGGPDTTTRVQNIWQARVAEDVSLNRCGEDADILMTEAGVGAGLLTIIKDNAATVDENPCVTPLDTDFRGLENRLYRVEVHQGGTVAGGASVKWSRYNGAVAFKVVEINASNRVLTLARLGWDQIVTLSANSWIELVSEADELAGRPGAMLQISADAGAVNDAQRQVTLKNVAGITAVLNGYDPENDNVKVRLWDTAAIVLNDHFDPATHTTEIILEDGIGIDIRVENPDDTFRTGDYWTFTARAIQGRVEELTDAPPQGPERHCCKLALIHWNPGEGAPTTIEDCRPLFPALTEMLQLHYVGGDGQEGRPGDTLPGPLMVRADRGEHPAANVPVIFEVKTEGLGGKIFTDTNPTGGDRIVVYTDGEGLAACQWQLGNNRTRYHQRVTAFIDAPADARRHQQVNFNANLSIAEAVSYLPPETCINIGKSVNTVAGALDALCAIEADGVTYTPPGDCTRLKDASTVAEALDALCTPAFHVEGIFWLLDDNEAVHDQTVPLKRFIDGLLIVCDDVPEPATIKQASVFVTLELPSDTLSGVMMSYILEGDLEVSGTKILWKPSARAERFLTQDIGRVVGTGGVFPARLFLKGSKIHVEGNPKIHMDGNVVNSPDEPHNLMLPSGNGVKGSTFEMWFNIEFEAIEIPDGIDVVGVLHPGSFMGFKITSKENTTITIENLPAVNSRLTAFDIAYGHRQAIQDAGISGYTVSETLLDRDRARSELLESGFDRDGDFGVNVLVQDEYERLAAVIIKEWQTTFDGFGLSFSLDTAAGEGIPDVLRAGNIDEDKPPISIVICDSNVLDTIRRQPELGEPDGIIRNPFFKRV
ncbi:DUF6519 domain-containing protein [Desulfococcus multivorans]|uniref:Uncharacterized protein n=1 Tax=Desulfococcus multivorans DSM 2059 TaxID=1121405 RepID=S7VEZ8_DESML|nr:DUF6519 domain-containing protein [Desulfococcus multivorans]AOY59395.1 conserved uncharacterized protein [Desulfococcus multivorans]AQV01606.1 hypothetical protein B2D07_13120 [Desulfococcus multivorans]EPR43053.1 hypothetical protein dsmv_1419 [Desulfococcus multivorans DSM 2059]SJZ99907.1 hypothetical protein SAMN02745446_02353 [Desulfococcus multivorans DSM 2059]